MSDPIWSEGAGWTVVCPCCDQLETLSIDATLQIKPGSNAGYVVTDPNAAEWSGASQVDCACGWSGTLERAAGRHAELAEVRDLVRAYDNHDVESVLSAILAKDRLEALQLLADMGIALTERGFNERAACDLMKEVRHRMRHEIDGD
jgi:hypothetical protein